MIRNCHNYRTDPFTIIGAYEDAASTKYDGGKILDVYGENALRAVESDMHGGDTVTAGSLYGF